jgi:acyl CoA:acetate/3-ketoacid CoA transferase beta subunit
VTADLHEQLVVTLSREVRRGETVVVGVGTPLALAAVLLAREVLGTVHMLMPAACDPKFRDIADYLVTPWAVGEDAVRASRMHILDAIAQGRVDLQFIRPAQVDAKLRVNTEFVETARGPRHLVGPVALPDVLHLVRRVVAYVPKHDRRVFIKTVSKVTAPRAGTRRGDEVAVTARASGTSETELAALTGFALQQDAAAVLAVPTPDELDLLRRVVDPLGLARLEDPDGRTAATATLVDAWRDHFAHDRSTMEGGT